jgi:hypothetical protein
VQPLRVNLKPKLADFLRQLLFVEHFPGMALVNIGNGGAVNRRVRPDRELGIAMLARIKASMLCADIQLLRQRAAKRVVSSQTPVPITWCAAGQRASTPAR